MNFLSHYILDAAWISDEELFGTLLVDLARLRGNGFRLKPWQVQNHSPEWLLKVRHGAHRHYEVDAWWHNSHIFRSLTSTIGTYTALPSQPVLGRKYFFEHIAAEMLLDRIAISDQPEVLSEYYGRLKPMVSHSNLRAIAIASGNEAWADKLLNESREFMESRFLESYSHPEDFVEKVFGIYSRVTMLEPPAKVISGFHQHLPNMEKEFLEVLKDSGLPWGN